MKRKYWLIVFLVLLFVLYISFHRTSRIEDSVVPRENENNLLGCSRLTRLENKPQYDRALSLIQQRLTEYNNSSFNTSDETRKFNFFTPALLNCIQITEQRQSTMDGVEGYFVFNGDDIKKDNFPIVVSSQYQSSDDIATAITLTHELTHVQQYIDFVNGKKKIDCVDNEVEAMMSQRYLYLGLFNLMEIQIVDLRMKNPGYFSKLWPEMDNPYKTVELIMKLFGESKVCDRLLGNKFENIVECRNDYLRARLKDVIEKDDYYRRQCSL